MRIKAVLMDLDGTITRFNLDYMGARRRALRRLEELGLKDRGLTEEKSIYVMLKGLKKRVKPRAFKELRAELFKIVEEMEIEAASKVEILPGAIDTIRELRQMGLKMAIVTNNGRTGTDKTIQRLNLQGIFDVIVTRDDSNELKPDKGSVRIALQRLGLEPGEAVFVGDGAIDVLAAKAAKVRSIAVPTGPFSIERLVTTEPDYFIGALEELPSLLSQLSREDEA